MTPRHALRIAIAASLLIQLWVYGVWWWITGGCFCSVGEGRRISEAAYALFEVAIYPVEHGPGDRLKGAHPIALVAYNFWIWLAAVWIPLRIGMLVAGIRRPVPRAT